jgi:cytochrome c peroxidase
MEGMYVGGQFWDGRVDTLEEQAMQPPLNPLEMHNRNKREVVAKLRRYYSAAFKKLFGPRALNNVDTAYSLMAQAIAEYERSSEVCRFDSKYDQYVANPQAVPLSDSELRGLALFTGNAKCKNCHSVDTTLAGKALFTSFGYQNIGVPKNSDNPFYFLPPDLNPDGADFVDLGLGSVLDDPNQYGKFKIPSLRNVAITAPYMHNGVFKTLKEVVNFDNTRDVASWPPPEVNMNVHRHMPPMPGTFGRLGLTEEEENDIVAFLMTLTDGYVQEN